MGEKMANVFSFPNPVNEHSARVVAGGVLILGAVTLATQQFWILPAIAYGFLARVASGPRFSPLGLLATKLISPRLAARPKLVAGPPKRFAQGMGAVITVGATLLALVFHQALATNVLLVLLLVAATLESVFAICIGCHVFAALMKVGVIPESVCEECNNINLRRA